MLRSDVLSMDDLLPGLHLKGTVRNVVDFGAFVDVGVTWPGSNTKPPQPKPPAPKQAKVDWAIG